MDEHSFMQMWEDHKVNLLRIAGCFRTNHKFKLSSDNCEEQFGGIRLYSSSMLEFLKKFIPGLLKMGGSKVNVVPAIYT